MFYTLGTAMTHPHAEGYQHLTQVVNELHNTEWEYNNDFWEQAHGHTPANNLILSCFKEATQPLGHGELHRRVHIKLWNAPLARDNWDVPSIPCHNQLQTIFESMNAHLFTSGPRNNDRPAWVLSAHAFNLSDAVVRQEM